MSEGHDSDREKKLRAGDQDRSIVARVNFVRSQARKTFLGNVRNELDFFYRNREN